MQVTIEYYGMVGKGRNVTEAKKNAGAQIADALEGEYTPTLVRWRGTLAVMARSPKSGWGYRFMHEAKQPCEQVYLSGGFDGREDCLRAMLIHIADNEQIEGESEADALFDSAYGLSMTARRELKRDFAERAQRNDRYRRRRRYAVDVLGMTNENDIHNFTLMNPAVFEIWRGTEEI